MVTRSVCPRSTIVFLVLEVCLVLCGKVILVGIAAASMFHLPPSAQRTALYRLGTLADWLLLWLVRQPGTVF